MRATAETVIHFKAHVDKAMKAFIRLPHRDKKSQVVPLDLFPGQRKYHDLIERMRAFAMAKQCMWGSENYRAMTDVPRGFKARVDYIEEVGATEFLRWTDELGLALVDGPVKIVVGKCRRGGFSAYTAARMILEANFSPAFRGFLMAHKGTNADLIFGYHRSFHQNWPHEMEEFKVATTIARDKRYQWAHDSIIRADTAGGAGAGRGDQADFYHFSEVAFYDDYGEVTGTLAAAPAHAWVIEESTANGPSGGYYDRWRGAACLEDIISAYDTGDADTVAKWNGYATFFYSWLEEPAYVEEVYKFERERLLDTLTDEEKDLVEHHGASLEQIKWRRNKLQVFDIETQGAQKLGLSPVQWFSQEYPHTPEVMFQSTGSKIFDPGKLKAMMDRAETIQPEGYWILTDEGPPIAVKKHQANLTVWEGPKPGHQYSIGGDSGKGLRHGDPSALVVLDRTDGTHAIEVALWHGWLNARELGDVAVALGEWYNHAFLTPEINDAGLLTCQRIVEDLHYPHIYHRATIDLIKGKAGGDGHTFRYGFHSTSVTKPFAVYALAKAILDDAIEFRSKIIIRELQAYEILDGRKKLGAPPGEHDDCVIAGMLGWFGHSRGAPPVDLKELQAKVKRMQLDPEMAQYWSEIKKKMKKTARKNMKKIEGYIPREWSI